MTLGKTKTLWWSITIIVMLIVAAYLLFGRRKVLPTGIVKDIRAAVKVRKIADPDQRLRGYLQNRYGSLDDPANRERAFRGFFDLDHIKGLRLIYQHSGPEQRQANVQALSRWIADYRQTMTPQEKAELGKYFRSDDGTAALRLATAQYISQDIRYRAASSSVITELMTTITAVEK